MGLDQFAYTTKGKNKEEIAYWRKHNALHGWMENLWEKQGCPKKHDEDGSFNCIPLELNMENLDKLEQDILGSSLPETQGFFFGADSRDDDHYKEKTLEFIATARQAIKDGKKVFYDSWW
jgi:hypothetical protein